MIYMRVRRDNLEFTFEENTRNWIPTRAIIVKADNLSLVSKLITKIQLQIGVSNVIAEHPEVAKTVGGMYAANKERVNDGKVVTVCLGMPYPNPDAYYQDENTSWLLVDTLKIMRSYKPIEPPIKAGRYDYDESNRFGYLYIQKGLSYPILNLTPTGCTLFKDGRETHFNL